jgi:hypothetical protein
MKNLPYYIIAGLLITIVIMGLLIKSDKTQEFEIERRRLNDEYVTATNKTVRAIDLIKKRDKRIQELEIIIEAGNIEIKRLYENEKNQKRDQVWYYNDTTMDSIFRNRYPCPDSLRGECPEAN